ncbi:hypothetical protein DMA39_22320 [Salmonella enterica subsp. enterica serovar Muenchen]|nr:hypothetical protein [Salmonella enterica subsp. enterica serovar Muenchen]ECR4176471.1 hypothetical protein [Salmonella enterica]EFU9020147.1 hypothetical protein [Salmonella enterica]
MNTLIKNVPIAKVGKVFDGREITLHMLERCRDTFCLQECQPDVGEIYTDWRQSPTIIHQGKVLSLKLDNDTLFADIEMFMSPEAVREKALYPGIAYLETKSTTKPALIAVILGDKPNRADNIAIRDCDICEAN